MEYFNENKSILSESFEKCVKGYHLINEDPIKESPWENINALVFKHSGCNIILLSGGSHKPGADLTCLINKEEISFSNKSARRYKSSFKISSYRLTRVCSSRDNGTIEEIIAEINKRKNFGYYSIIVREESDTSIRYEWYVIPADYPELNPESYVWKKKVNKKDSVTGWETDEINGSSMSISFSMSSQLWIDLKITDELKKFRISKLKVKKERKYDYIELYEKIKE
jgi:hypothetical protein